MADGSQYPTAALDPYAVLGNTGLRAWSGYIHEEFHPRLQGLQAAKIYREMSENDATIGAVLNLINGLFRQLEFRADPADASSEAADEAAFLESCIGDMSHSWSEFINEVLTEVVYGWSYFEIVYKLRQGPGNDPSKRSRYDDGRIGWRKLAPRSQDTLQRWEIEPDGGIRGLWQQAPPNYQANFIPIEKSLLFRAMTTKNNPEGLSSLRRAYRSWHIVKRLQELEATGAERDLAGYPILQVPVELMLPDAPPALKMLRASLEKLIQQIKRDEREGALVPTELDREGKPTGYKLGLLNSGGAKRNFPIDTIIPRYQTEIARIFHADFMMLGTGSVGSFALASNKTNTFAVVLKALRDSILETLNRFAVPRLMTLNNVPEELWPTICAGDFEKQPLDEIGAYIQQTVAAGVITPDNGLEKRARELGNLPQPDEETLAMLRRGQVDNAQTQDGGRQDGETQNSDEQPANTPQDVGA